MGAAGRERADRDRARPGRLARIGGVLIGSPFRERLHRLRSVPLTQVPAIAGARMKRAALRRVERWFYRPDRPPLFSARPRAVFRPLGLFHPDVRRPDFAARFRSAFPDDAKVLVELADNAARGLIDLLGSGPVDLPAFLKRSDLRLVDGPPGDLGPATDGRLPWHFDFKSGFGWSPRTFFADIRYGHVPGADVKVPWELSRASHFVTLGQAFRLTGERRYADAFLSQWTDWIDRNPVKFGVNWACPMDVALRACNWIAAAELFWDDEAVRAALSPRLPALLWHHGNHIRAHLEWGGPISSNHYLADLLGLAYIGLALDNREWMAFARRELTAEILKQTYADGLDYEGSTLYHRLVLEIAFFFTLAITRGTEGALPRPKLEERLGGAFVARLNRMFETVQRLVGPDGRAPSIGDNDSGRVHSLAPRGDADLRYLLEYGARLFGAERLSIAGLQDGAPAAWLFGWTHASDNTAPVDFESVPPRASVEPGLLVLRGPQDHLVLVAQPNGTRGVGNHTHNDKLSVTLAVASDHFLGDPGSGVYTPNPAVRNRLRSTAAHSTVMIDGQEQNRLDFRSLFTLGDDARITIDEWHPNERLAASHHGYGRLPSPVFHTRAVERWSEGPRWRIEDRFGGEGKHQLRWTFVFGPGIQARLVTPRQIRLTGRSGALEIECASDVLAFELEAGEWSPAYGVVQPTTVARLTASVELPFRAAFDLKWSAIGPHRGATTAT